MNDTWLPYRSENGDRTAEALYLRNMSNHKVVGVMVNRRYNFVSLWDAFDGVPDPPENECIAYSHTSGINEHWSVWGNFAPIAGVSAPLVFLNGDGSDVQIYDPLYGDPNQAIYSGPATDMENGWYLIDGVDLDQDHPILFFRATPWFGRLSNSDSAVAEETLSSLTIFDSEVQVWPNPTNDNLTIKASFSQALNKRPLITVFDMYGRKVLETYQNNGRTELDLKSLRVGCYVIRFSSADRVMFKRIEKI